MKFLEEYRYLRKSLMFGYSVIVLGLALGVVFDSLIFVALIALVLAVRYALISISPHVKKSLPIWATFDAIEKVINRRASNRFRFFGGFWASLALGVLIALTKGTLISFFILLKETEVFFRFRKRV
ncbi:hypothetical protein BAMA_04735 [Bacillus manliponensis]|uniref:Uncharacterized protein n=1 Tax=Bacillus manliponensis TaxID=574376 RepID=A0A073JWE7_9BACI|nr:hypothetical protein [Bacillus manliponensis]KEK18571.1 hypothetical protein BAMA_04735 [Bacillus manliponensis]